MDPLPDSASVLARTRLLQLDPLIRVDKAHRLTCLTRMPDTTSVQQIDAGLWCDTTAVAFETWVHAVCLVPITDWPLLSLYRERVRESAKRPSQEILDEVRAIVAEHPVGATISDIEQPGSRGDGWNWSERKRATEHMLRTGELVCTTRRGTKRLFDLPERRVPTHLRATDLNREQILTRLTAAALRAMGVATTADVATYYNLSPDVAHDGLIAARAQPVTVEGWDAAAWIPSTTHDALPNARMPVLVGPFDNLIWDRKRVRRVFDFDYLFEAYKPQAQRRHGHYVLALLDGDKFTGRVDLQRDGAALNLLASYPEPLADPVEFEASLAAALARLRSQLGLEQTSSA
jgi:uncharacterized protein YcaQ